MFFRINFQDGYRILDQTRLLMKYTDESSTRSRNLTSEQAFVNASRILLEVPHSRVRYQRFRVNVALQVGDAVGPFVSDGDIHSKHVWYGYMFPLLSHSEVCSNLWIVLERKILIKE